MSFYFDLGKTAVTEFEKNAGWGHAVGKGLDFATSAIKPLLSFGGKAIGTGLKTPGTRLATAGGLALGGLGANELAAGAAAKTGLPIPHFGDAGDQGQKMWAPHEMGALLDPKQTGWRAAQHAVTRPFQTVAHMLGYTPKFEQNMMHRGYNPDTGGINFTRAQLNDPKLRLGDGDMTIPFGQMSNVEQTRLMQFKKMRDEMEARYKGFNAGPAFDPDQPRKLTRHDFPFQY
jgi:hypothetical protein